MANANVQIIQLLKSTIEKYCNNDKNKDAFLIDKKGFLRSRKLNFSLTTYFILGFLKSSLQVEIQNLFRSDLLSKNLKFSKSAICQRRQKISSKWFIFLLEQFCKFYYENNTNFKTWRGYKLLSIDGSTAYLINDKDLAEEFKGGSNQHGKYVIARYVKMYDTLNKITLKANLIPMTKSEREVSYDWAKSIPDDSLTLLDRGFPSFALFYLMLNTGKNKHFIMRCKADFTNNVKAFVNSAKTTDIIKFSPDYRAVKLLKEYGIEVTSKTYIMLRIEKIILDNGELEILITSIFDANILTNMEMKVLYNKRWGIETSIGHEKNLFQLELFSSHTKNGIEQDFYSSFLIANIHSLIYEEAQEEIEKIVVKTRKYDRQINKSASINVFKNEIYSIYFQKDIYLLIKEIKEVFKLFTEPIRPNRKSIRRKYTNRRSGKHQTKKNYRNNL